MRNISKKSGNAMLIILTMIWGSGFIATKYCMEAGVSAGLVNAVRGIVLVLCSFLFFHKKILKMTRLEVKVGLIAGITNALAFLTQTIGLLYSSPSICAFLTVTYVIFVPVFSFVFYHKRLKWTIFPAILLALAGAYFITGISFAGFKLDLGVVFSLVGAILFAISIAYIGNSPAETDPEVTGFWMGITMFLVNFIYYAAADRFSVPESVGKVILPLLYLGIFGSFVTTTLQVFSQRSTDETTASMIMSLEAVFATVFSVLFGYDRFGWKLAAGGLLILAGVSIIIIDWEKLFQKKPKQADPDQMN